MAGDNHFRTIYKNRVGEAERADAPGDLTDLVFGMDPRVPRVRDKILNFLVGDLQLTGWHSQNSFPWKQGWIALSLASLEWILSEREEVGKGLRG